MDAATSTDPIQRILECFHQRGHSNYGKEAVTQLEHALQAAYSAEKAAAPAELVAAALLHDVGHLLHDLPEDAPDHDIDDRHEQLGAEWLADYFTPAVVEPIRLHVAAKRYLCTKEPGYFEKLSEPSVQSLALQGGPMTAAQAAHFESHPHFEAAIHLRRWDEAAKIPGLPTPPVEYYVEHLQKSLLR
ncbi:MAG: HD domain-containing protein [Pirellulales bacterium]|nr:HD domain-containing protein [Pirellulales bacterium]